MYHAFKTEILDTRLWALKEKNLSRFSLCEEVIFSDVSVQKKVM